MGCAGSRLGLEGVEIDLNASPSEVDRALYDRARAVLNQCDSVLDSLATYESCAVPCREALGDPTPENRYRALEAVTRTAMLVYRYHTHSKSVCESASAILARLMSDVSPSKSKVNPVRDIKYEEHSAIIVQLMQIFSFMFRFDNLKTYHGAIQNDLSMYRRMCQISKKSITEMAAGRGEAIGRAAAGDSGYKPGGEHDMTSEDYISRLYEWSRPVELDPDSVSDMSFFIASPIPVMFLAVNEFTKLAEDDSRVDTVFPHVVNLLIMIAHEKRFGAKSDNYARIAEAITAAIIVTDRVEPEGVFNKRSQVEVTAAITLLQKRAELFADEHNATGTSNGTQLKGEAGETGSLISERHTAGRANKMSGNADTDVAMHHVSVTVPGEAGVNAKRGSKKYRGGKVSPTSHMLSGIRYWTIHFEDITTLPEITRKLESV